VRFSALEAVFTGVLPFEWRWALEVMPQLKLSQ
jgi:hypothetical protein